MLRPVVKQFKPNNGLDPPPGLPLRQTLLLKCGHFARRKPNSGMWTAVHCELCGIFRKERESKDEKRSAKKERRRIRRLRQQMKVEIHNMAKKKMAPAKVAKKKDLKKKGAATKTKKEKGERVKVGRKLVLVGKHLFAPKGSLLAKALKAFQVAEKHTLGENELVIALEKAGAKAEGKKTVKKLVKAILRNMLRAGVVVKYREIKNNEELKSFIDGDGDGGDEDETADESDESESDDEDADESEDEDGDGDGDSEDVDESEDESDDDDAEEEKPKKKKKVVGKKK